MKTLLTLVLSFFFFIFSIEARAEGECPDPALQMAYNILSGRIKAGESELKNGKLILESLLDKRVSKRGYTYGSTTALITGVGILTGGSSVFLGSLGSVPAFLMLPVVAETVGTSATIGTAATLLFAIPENIQGRTTYEFKTAKPNKVVKVTDELNAIQAEIRTHQARHNKVQESTVEALKLNKTDSRPMGWADIDELNILIKQEKSIAQLWNEELPLLVRGKSRINELCDAHRKALTSSQPAPAKLPTQPRAAQ